ncbi:sulfurtransferase TusA family protein [Desulfovibrio legallii]|jgi:TusA-related sulfurtransferase|uniref:TusA-related sulfurtransferase n=1 Tax=Desulfovibrio legallii TaxID=571438 RepID=A0A1G7N465_9BACT|nr:sulfurtransferase TusA family protein [Desulfovibrio legallii]SDF68731.1 TusA-related sulfurtransferase [Desulfovibrio legallii]
MSQLIDTRGLSCPQPVLMFLTAVKQRGEGPFSVLVDNDASRENVSRAARNHGLTVEAVEAADQGLGVTRLEIRKA